MTKDRDLGSIKHLRDGRRQKMRKQQEGLSHKTQSAGSPKWQERCHIMVWDCILLSFLLTF